MKKIFILFFIMLLAGCYSQLNRKYFQYSPQPDEIDEDIAFLPDADFELCGGAISDLTNAKWTRSFNEEIVVEQIFRTGNQKYSSNINRIETYRFLENGNCSYKIWYFSTRKQPWVPQLRWRLLKSNPNILLIYTTEATFYRKIRIEELSENYLKLIVIE